jgi:hypothetical protein
MTEKTPDSLLQELQKPTTSVEIAGQALGLSRNGAYDAIQRGEIDVIRIGRKIRCITAQAPRYGSGVINYAPNSSKAPASGAGASGEWSCLATADQP